jgi:hypothetical protein
MRSLGARRIREEAGVRRRGPGPRSLPAPAPDVRLGGIPGPSPTDDAGTREGEARDIARMPIVFLLVSLGEFARATRALLALSIDPPAHTT